MMPGESKLESSRSWTGSAELLGHPKFTPIYWDTEIAQRAPPSGTYALDAALTFEADRRQVGLPAGLAVGLAVHLHEADMFQLTATVWGGADEAGRAPALAQGRDERTAGEHGGES